MIKRLVMAVAVVALIVIGALIYYMALYTNRPSTPALTTSTPLTPPIQTVLTPTIETSISSITQLQTPTALSSITIKPLNTTFLSSTTSPSYIMTPTNTETRETTSTPTPTQMTQSTTLPQPAFTVTSVAPSIVVSSYTQNASCYDVVEINFDVSGIKYSNPFDSSEIDVYATILTPDNKLLAVPAFYTKDYEIQNVSLNEDLVVFMGKPHWSIRFTPQAEGVYKVSLIAKSKDVEIRSNTLEIYVKSCDKSLKGFAHFDKDSGYIRFDNGSSQILIGLDLAWAPKASASISFYRSWFERLSNSGVKVVRIGLVPWSLNLEWNKLHSYDLASAARLDEILELARKYDIYIIFVFMWHDELASKWSDNPYNAKNGGFLASPEQFWSNQKAIEIFKDRVRYVIARWGYSPNIIAWELVNEADLTTNFYQARDSFVSWVANLSSYVKSLDPYKRAVTISLADYNSEPRVWQLDTIDIITVHRYGPSGLKDIASAFPEIIESLRAKYGKPVVITEFGDDYRWIGYPGFTGTPYWALDKSGVGLHEGLWSSIFAGSPISAMSWWWDTQIERYSLFYHFKALSNFLGGLDPLKSGLSKVDVVVENATTGRGYISNITIYPMAGWITPGGGQQKQNTYVINPNGSIEGDLSLLSSFVYGKSHYQNFLNPIFNVTMLQKGRFIIHINSVGRGGAKASIYVDGVKIKEVDLPDKDGKSDEAANEYGIDIEVDLEPGEHAIKIDNDGVDWFTWDYIIIENAVYAKAKIQALALGNRTFVMLWIRNKDYNWWNVINNVTIDKMENVTISLNNLEDGVYKIEFWDTYQGIVVHEENVNVSGGRIEIVIKELDKDIAIKIFKIG
ncbi:MAG: cellulase family glycosylhydrolase [Ignisphaera sp.]